MRELATSLAKVQQWQEAQWVIASISDNDWKARALRALVSSLVQRQQWQEVQRVIAPACRTAMSKRRRGVMKRHQQFQQELKEKAGPLWKDSGYVFCNSLGAFYHAGPLSRRYKKLLRRANLPNIRFHDLRHSAATILMSIGVNPKMVQELLGHADVVTTLNIYSHVLPSMQQDAAQKLDNLYRRNEPTGDDKNVPDSH